MLLAGIDGLLVPGGFGYRGIEGKIKAIEFARKCEIPYFGICLGMQTAVIEYARNVLGLAGANSTEFAADTSHPVICMLEDQRQITNKGGTMRLGAQPCVMTEGSKSQAAYKAKQVSERHRHRYEFNPEYRSQFEAAGMKPCGTSPDGKLVEIVELENHPWFVAVQYHPEFKSKPQQPHPLFRDFIAAAIVRHQERTQTTLGNGSTSDARTAAAEK
jgi:CTP synthase